jgi:hypothetical protein
VNPDTCRAITAPTASSNCHSLSLITRSGAANSARPVVEPGKKFVAVVVITHFARHCAGFRGDYEGAFHVLLLIAGRRPHADPFDGSSFFMGCKRVIPFRRSVACYNERRRPDAPEMGRRLASWN